MRGWYLSKYTPEPEPYHPKRDVWLHYASPRHVAEWAQFFKPRLVAMLQTFAARYQPGA